MIAKISADKAAEAAFVQKRKFQEMFSAAADKRLDIAAHNADQAKIKRERIGRQLNEASYASVCHFIKDRWGRCLKDATTLLPSDYLRLDLLDHPCTFCTMHANKMLKDDDVFYAAKGRILACLKSVEIADEVDHDDDSDDGEPAPKKARTDPLPTAPAAAPLADPPNVEMTDANKEDSDVILESDEESVLARMLDDVTTTTQGFTINDPKQK